MSHGQYPVGDVHHLGIAQRLDVQRQFQIAMAMVLSTARSSPVEQGRGRVAYPGLLGLESFLRLGHDDHGRLGDGGRPAPQRYKCRGQTGLLRVLHLTMSVQGCDDVGAVALGDGKGGHADHRAFA